MPNKNYYSILGIDKSATSDEIKQAYRNLARKYHPDMVREKDKSKAEEKFKDLCEAYECLMDKTKRRMYDMVGSAGIEQTYWGPNGFDFSMFSHVEDLQDIIGVVVENIIAHYFPGDTGSIFNDLLRTTGVIKNKKGKNKGKTRKCENCNGTGEVLKPILNGLINIINQCQSCNGTGRITK